MTSSLYQRIVLWICNHTQRIVNIIERVLGVLVKFAVHNFYTWSEWKRNPITGYRSIGVVVFVCRKCVRSPAKFIEAGNSAKRRPNGSKLYINHLFHLIVLLFLTCSKHQLQNIDGYLMIYWKRAFTQRMVWLAKTFENWLIFFPIL